MPKTYKISYSKKNYTWLLKNFFKAPTLILTKQKFIDCNSTTRAFKYVLQLYTRHAKNLAS